MSPRIEALLAARLFMAPQRVGERLYFISDLNGRLSLYVMDLGGSVPEPLLPPDVALQNPHHMPGVPFVILPNLNKILVMLDDHGDENYQPMLIDLEGGFPEPLFPQFAGMQVSVEHPDIENNHIYLHVDARKEAKNTLYHANLATGELDELGTGVHGPFFVAASADHRFMLTADGYGIGDNVIYLQDRATKQRKPIFGIPIDQRDPNEPYEITGTGGGAAFINDDYVLGVSMRFDDTYGLILLKTDGSQQIEPVTITGIRHDGIGELDDFAKLANGKFMLGYNIDGCSWRYEGSFDLASRTFTIEHVLCGAGTLANGVLESIHYDEASDSFALSFSTATSPTQIYTLEGADRATLRQHTREKILGIPNEHLAAGEDASFVSHDGLRVSARLYLPAPELGFAGKRPLVYYIHGGPQSQERPDFAWFSMPLIQFLTLNGFAVFVPNARGSTGYGFDYMNRVTKDWGGQDRLDHVHAMTTILPNDPRIDVANAGVMGRSYGGYMTLTLAARHPELWKAAIDMFGPYDLLTFSDRIPETWKPYFVTQIGDPVNEREILVERSPKTYMDNLQAAMLVLQGAKDPRVIEQESRDVVAHLQELGKQADIYVFEDEGHDVLKFANKVRCYTMITDFFVEHLASQNRERRTENKEHRT